MAEDFSVNDTANDTVTLSSRQLEIIQSLKENSQLTSSALATQLEVSEITIKNDINKLRKYGILSRQGTDKNGKWIVQDEGITILHKGQQTSTKQLLQK